MDSGLDVVTGAFSYTGRAIARLLVERGRRVRTLTNHPSCHPSIETAPLAFGDAEALAAAIGGAETLYNTYWVRFERSGVAYEHAVANTRRLVQACRRAGVGRLVHVSIVNPSIDSPYPYFRGKAACEAAVAASGIPYAIVRPTLVFGDGDVLVNNIAWLLRRFPVFPVPGDGRAPVRPVHVDDVARLCVDAALADHDLTVDAVGPERLTFAVLVGAVRDAVGSRARLVGVPVPLALALARLAGALRRDVLLTRDELAGLQAGLVDADGPATGHVTFTRWLETHAAGLGLRYASELDRHYRARGGRTQWTTLASHGR